jgi:transcription termination/antitermination protein NusA
VQRVRDAERERQHTEYKDRVGEIVNGIVKRVEFGNVTVDLGRAEAVLRRDETIPRETFKVSTACAPTSTTCARRPRGPQIFLSRTHPQFMAKLFAQEVPEIYDGIIEIKAVARDPGSRAKIGVVSNDSSIDPVGACVGMRGSRVQAVVQEIQGEKIDIIPWSPDPATFVVNALAPRKWPRSCSTRRTTASRSWCRTTSSRSPSAGAARTCASPRADRLGRSTS